MSTEDNIVLASTYRLTAVAFQESAKILHKEFQRKEEITTGNIRAIPYYYLLSHACELFLKSALLKRGITDAELKKSHARHNLSELLKVLESKGVIVSENTKWVVSGLSTQHAKHYLRYTALLDDGNKVFMPLPEQIYETLDELLMTTRLNHS